MVWEITMVWCSLAGMGRDPWWGADPEENSILYFAKGATVSWKNISALGMDSEMGSLACVALIYPDFTRAYLCAANKLESVPCIIEEMIFLSKIPHIVFQHNLGILVVFMHCLQLCHYTASAQEAVPLWLFLHVTLWHHGGPHEYFIFSWWSTTDSPVVTFLSVSQLMYLYKLFSLYEVIASDVFCHPWVHIKVRKVIGLGVWKVSTMLSLHHLYHWGSLVQLTKLWRVEGLSREGPGTLLVRKYIWTLEVHEWRMLLIHVDRLDQLCR